MKLPKIFHPHYQLALNHPSPFAILSILIALITALSVMVGRVYRPSWLSIFAGLAVLPLLCLAFVPRASAESRHSVTISPTTASVQAAGGTQQFTVTVSDHRHLRGVRWTLSGAGCSGSSCGSISAATSKFGTEITYTAPPNVPNPALVTLTATSICKWLPSGRQSADYPTSCFPEGDSRHFRDSSETASASITVTPQPALGQSCSNTVVVSHVKCISSATNSTFGAVSVTFSSGYSAGTIIIAQGATNGSQTFTPGMLTNTAGYAWTYWGSCRIGGGGTQGEALWYHKVTTTNPSSDTITFSGMTSRQWLNVVLYSGLGPIDGTGLCGSTNGTQNVSGNYIVHNGDINIGLSINDNGTKVGTGWNNREQDTICPACTMIEDQVQGLSPATLYQNNFEDASNAPSAAFSQPTQHYDMLLIGGGTDPSGTAGAFTSAPTITGEHDTMTQISTFTTSDGFGNQKLWANYNMEGGHTPTMTCNTTRTSGGPNSNIAGCYYLELTGANTLDQIASTGVENSAPSPLTSLTITTTHSNEIIVCIASNSHYSGAGFISAGSGFTGVAFSSQGIEYKTVSTKGSYSCTMNLNGNPGDYIITIASFYQSGTITANARFGFGGGAATIGVSFKQATTSEKAEDCFDHDDRMGLSEKAEHCFDHDDRMAYLEGSERGGKLSEAGLSVTISPKRAGLTIAQTLPVSATVQNDVGVGGVTWSASGPSCSGSSCGTFINVTPTSATYVAPSSAGIYSITATSVADIARSASTSIGVTDLSGVFMYHNDLSRDGTNTREFALTTSNVNISTFGKLFSCPADGAINAQPLWVPNLTVGGSSHNVIIVATQHDSLYAFDADAASCTVLWHVNLISFAHVGTADETSVASGGSGALVGSGFGDISPEVGITGTPVIDPKTYTVYVVSKSVNAGREFFQRLHAIDLTTGNERVAPQNIDGSISVPGTGAGSVDGKVVFDPRSEAQSSGLVLSHGVVYVAWASHEDADPYHGWIVGFDASTLAPLANAAFNSTPNQVGTLSYSRGGIGMGGDAPAVDSTGNLFFVTGNGTFDANIGGRNYGDSIVKLSTASGLSVADYFTPFNQASLDANDIDFGSGAATILVDQPSGVTHFAIGGGEDGNLFLLNRDNLGKFSSSMNSVIQTINLGYNIFTAPVFWQNNLYVAGVGPLLQYVFNTATGQFNGAPYSQSSSRYGFPGATPSLSSNGSTNGIIWALDNSLSCTPESPGCGATVLHAYDATNLATDLWNSSQAEGNRDQAGHAVKFTVPTVANGKVYVGTRGNESSVLGELDVYGLLPN